MSAPESMPDIERRSYDELFQFGGSLKLVRKEHERIMPFFVNAHRVVDIGCGRGVFLQMLREKGIEPVGVDLSPESVKYCQDAGFKYVFHEDAHGFLQRHKDVFDAMLCSHIVEHMPYDPAIALIRAAYDALAPGGRMVIITPNAKDLRVIGENFWLDPTHVRPYPMMLLESMLRSVGFDIAHKAQPLGRPTRRGLFRWPILALLMGEWFGHPNTIIVGQKPGVTSSH